MFAWLPLWVLVLLAGGCEHWYAKGVNGSVYFFMPKEFNGEMTASYESGYDRMWSSSVKIVPEREVKKLGDYAPSSITGLEDSNCYVFIVGMYGLEGWGNFKMLVQLSIDGEAYRGTIAIPYLNHPNWGDGNVRDGEYNYDYDATSIPLIDGRNSTKFTLLNQQGESIDCLLVYSSFYTS